MFSKTVKMLGVPFQKNFFGTVYSSHVAGQLSIIRSTSFLSKSRAITLLSKPRNLSSFPSRRNFDDEDKNGTHKFIVTLSGVLIAAIIYTVFDSKKHFEWFTVHAAKPIAENEKKHEINNNSKDKKVSKRQQFNFIADVVEKVAKSVVCIEVKDHTMIDWFDGSPRTSNTGSGFIIQEDGLILTNAHVVNNRGRTSLSIRLLDGQTFHGTVIGIDPESDLALIRIPAKGLPVLDLGCSADTRVGEYVCAIGSPLSLSNSVTAGVISSVKRGASELGIRNNISYIQTDATITFGNSGGPLVNLDGEAIGVNSMKIAAGISFAIPIDHVKKFLAQVEGQQKSGKAQTNRRYIGLTLVTLTDDIVAQLDQNDGRISVNRGVLVWKVVVGSPAYLAGIKPGDIIVKINSTDVTTAKDIYDALEVTHNLIAVINRGGTRYQCTIHPEDAPT